MKINSAPVGASCINWLNSRGDIVEAFKSGGSGFESHPGKLFYFFIFTFSNFFIKKSTKNIPKLIHYVLGHVIV